MAAKRSLRKNLLVRAGLLAGGVILLTIAYAWFNALIGVDESVDAFGGNRRSTPGTRGSFSTLAFVIGLPGVVMILLALLPKSAWRQVLHTFKK